MFSDAVVRGDVLVQSVAFAPFASTEDLAEVEPVLDSVNTGIDEQELARLREEARAEGYAAGLALGRDEGERALRRQSERLRQLVDQARLDVEQAVGQLDGAILELVLTIASRITERTLVDQSEIVGDVVRSALAAAAGLSILRVRVNPMDYPFLHDIWPSLDLSSNRGEVELREDPAVEVGGCIVDTATGFVDAQPSTRLEELRRQIFAALGEVG